MQPHAFLSYNLYILDEVSVLEFYGIVSIGCQGLEAQVPHCSPRPFICNIWRALNFGSSQYSGTIRSELHSGVDWWINKPGVQLQRLSRELFDKNLANDLPALLERCAAELCAIFWGWCGGLQPPAVKSGGGHCKCLVHQLQISRKCQTSLPFQVGKRATKP